MKKLHLLSVIAASVGVLSLPVSAQIITPEITADITAVGTDITTVGLAIIGLAVIALAVRWVKATFF